jgi:hypothetical protein
MRMLKPSSFYNRHKYYDPTPPAIARNIPFASWASGLITILTLYQQPL